VETLAHFHSIITELFEKLTGSSDSSARAKENLKELVSKNYLEQVLQAAIDRSTVSELATLIDLHRIGLTYVTNKKGGDQIIAAEAVEFEKKHRALGFAEHRLQTDLITGAMDAGHIQSVIDRAEDRPSVGTRFRGLNDCLRSIVATSAVSHGVDVEELNSMFFAGMPSDIAEYIQASSRVGRAHVGFCVLVPTPQRARDRYIVEVHDIFHRFLERMIAPAAIDRWAEKAVERVVASFLQTFLCGVRSIQGMTRASEGQKGSERIYRLTQEAKAAERENALALKRDISQFIEAAVGLRSPYAPQDIEHYQGLIRSRVNDIFNDMSMTRFSGSELGKFLAIWRPDLRPMLSLRDVDKPGRIVAASRDARDEKNAKADQIRRAMRFIRHGTGAAIDDDDED
ncbi:MAG TPA: helicase-related protein, partial [Steroidobacteraceae bacterium]|nr:helicase-related protein [Steroidobacteraceae bacterium]